MYPHDYYDIHGEPRLHNVGEGRPYLVNDYHANDHGPQLPGLSTIGRGPRGEGLYVDNVVKTDSEVSFGLYSDLTGELVWQSPNLAPALIEFVPTSAEHTVAGKPAPLTIRQTSGGVTKSTTAYLPAGEQGSRIYTIEDRIQKNDNDVYFVPVEDVTNIGGNKDVPPVPRVNDLLAFILQSPDDVGLAFGHIVNVSGGEMQVVAREYLSFASDILFPIDYENDQHIENIPLKQVAGYSSGPKRWMTQLNAILPVSWGTGVYATKEYGASNASGEYAHAEGNNTVASGGSCHAEGAGTAASGYQSHAEGGSTIASGDNSHAEGSGCKALGNSSHAEGGGTTASGNFSHAEGSGGTTASGQGSHAEGNETTAFGAGAHAEGYKTRAQGNRSHAEGNESQTAMGASDAHAEGVSTQATGPGAHAEGRETISGGYYTHAEGYSTEAVGSASHAEGYLTKALGSYSHAEGEGTIANCNNMHAGGSYNATAIDLLEAIGNGADDDHRSNARTLDVDGNEWLAGDLTVTVNGVEHTIASLIARIEALES